MDLQREPLATDPNSAAPLVTDRPVLSATQMQRPAPVPSVYPLDPMERHGAEWGLASLITGGMLVIAALVLLHLAVLTRDIGHRYFDRFTIHVVLALLGMLTMVVLPLSLLSVVGGLRGCLSARSRRQPVALGLMGLFLSVMAFGLWVCAVAAGFAVLVEL